jgi:hypothetical protein
MKPFIYRVKGTECYIDRGEPGYSGLYIKSDKTKATIWRSKTNEITKTAEWPCNNGHIKFMVDKEDTNALNMLNNAGYPSEEWYRVYDYEISLENLEVVPVEDKEISKPTFTGSYVIKIKGAELYLRPSTDTISTLSTDKAEAKVFSNPKTDIIGKMERGMTTAGTAQSGTVPAKQIWIFRNSKRGLKVSDYILTNPAAKSFASSKVTQYGRTEKIFDIVNHAKTMDIGCCFDLPVEFFEREQV